jgi:NADPH2:quinone reductase
VIPDKMRAVVADTPGGPEVLTLVERPVPTPGPGQILIRVEAAGVNRPDLLQRLGNYKPPPGASDVLGLEVAGEVAALGEGASLYQVGEFATALLPGGGYAEYAVVHESNALPVPQSLSVLEAAAVPETFFTVWTNVFERGALKSGEWLLVHGGASGIGTTAIQLAKALGSRVIATVGSDEKANACRKLGADVAINYNTADFVAATREATGKGADVILDMVGGDYVVRNYAAAAVDGRIVQIAFLRGATPQVDLALLMTKRLTHTGSTLRPRSVAEKASIAEHLRETVWPLLEAGGAKPIIDSTFPLDQADKAHVRMESSAHFGKIVLTI